MKSKIGSVVVGNRGDTLGPVVGTQGGKGFV